MKTKVLLTAGKTHAALSLAGNTPLINSTLSLSSLLLPPPVCQYKAKKLDHLQPDCFVDLLAEAVHEASKEPEGEVVVVVRARDSPMLLNHVVPHPRPLGSSHGGDIAQVVISMLPDPGVQGPGSLPMVNLVLQVEFTQHMSDAQYDLLNFCLYI